MGGMNRLKPFYTSFSRTPHLQAPLKWPPQVFLAFFSESKTMELRRNRLLKQERLYYSIFYTSPECCSTAEQGSPTFHHINLCGVCPSFLLLTLSELPQTCSITDSLHFHPKSLVFKELDRGGKTVKLPLKGRNCLSNQNFPAVKAKSTGMQGFAFRKKGEVFFLLLIISFFSSLFSELLTFSSPLLLPGDTQHSCPLGPEPDPSQSGHLGTRCGPSFDSAFCAAYGRGRGGVTKEKAVL